MVEVEIARIVVNENQQEQLIVLKEIDGSRHVPIVIGMVEVASIKVKLSDLEIERPLSHDLIVTILTYLDADLDRLIIDDMRDGVFFAKMCVINNDDEEMLIDCRPSDGIAVALRMESPIFVEEDVFEKAMSLEKG